MKAVLLLALVAAASTQPQLDLLLDGETCATGREYKPASVQCPDGQTVSSVGFAAWGMLSEGSDCSSGESSKDPFDKGSPKWRGGRKKRRKTTMGSDLEPARAF